MSTNNNVKAHRPKRLDENETLTSFEDWRNNLLFYLGQETKFAPFLVPAKTWGTVAENASHRGLADAAALRTLQNFLGVIASLAPPLLHGDIISDTKSLNEVFTLIRTYYQFAPSEATFIKFSEIKREVTDGILERPMHLYLRMRQFIRDNLLLKPEEIYLAAVNYGSRRENLIEEVEDGDGLGLDFSNNLDQDSTDEDAEPTQLRRSTRIKRQPEYIATEELQRVDWT